MRSEYPRADAMHAPLSSSGRRFLATLGFSVFQALAFGGIIALLVYFRVPRAEDEDDPAPSIARRLRRAVERAELLTYDWRARELGRTSVRPDEVVVVTFDDDTLSAARKDEDARLGAYPWPRALWGDIAGRLIDEGAALVVFEPVFSDLSPRTCVDGCPGGPDPAADDVAFRAALDQRPGRTLLTFAGAPDSSRFGGPPRPYLLFVERRSSELEARDVVRRILTARRPAFAIPEGNRVEIWAGAGSEDDGRALAEALGVRAPILREMSPAERAYEVTATDLLASMAEVKVDGIDPAKLPRVRSLLHPVAPLLGPRSEFGSARPQPDSDGVVRGYPHLIQYAPRDGDVRVLASAPLVAAMRMAGTRALRYERGVLHVGSRFAVPMDESGYSLIRWDAAPEVHAARGTLKRELSAWRLAVNLRDRGNGLPQRFRNEMDGRVAVVADTTSYSNAFSDTPVQARVSDGAILGQALANLLRSDGIRRSSPRADAMLVLGMAFLGAFFALTFAASIRTRIGGAAYAILLLVAGGAYVFLARLIFLDDRLWIPVAGPLIAMVATVLGTTTYALRAERRIHEFVYGLLGQHISPEVARLVSRDLSIMRPERRQATIAFCDIQGFTHLSEELPPERLARLLNEFLTEMTAVVRTHGGQVEYKGDTLMAFWGAPVRTDRHAHLACESVLLMRDALTRNRDEWEERYRQRIDFRAGMNSGEVLAGNMGSELKANYTVLGEPVSLASRLERAARELGTWLLVGEGTARIASDAFAFREVDRMRVRGKPLPWTLFELMGRRGELAEAQQKLMALHEWAMLAYHERRFQEALELFSQIHEELSDPVARVYAERCKKLLETPPPEEWDGVYEQLAA